MGHKHRRGKGGGRKKRGSGALTSSTTSLRAAADSLRFTIGSRVECCINSRDEVWLTATIVKLFYDTEMGDIGIVPYQLQCDDGALFFAPYDSEDCVRASSSPPMQIKFPPGTRVSFKYCLSWDWKTGTVISTNEHWADDINWKTAKDIRATDAPYKIMFDDGRTGNFYGPEQWIQFSAPPMPVTIKQNARVECKMEPKKREWRLGTVISSKEDWLERESCPYYIIFDDDTKGRFYGPEEQIREVPLRFKVGDRVDFPRVKHRAWTGTIVNLWVTKGEGEKARTVPYDVRFDDGTLFHAGLDTDEYIKASEKPPLDIKYAKGTRVECKMEDGVWRKGTVVESNKDWVDHDRSPYYIRFVSDDGKPQYEGFWGPNDCIRESTLSDVTADFTHLTMFDADINDDLFSPPPLRSDCPICFIPLPVKSNEYHNRPCCGNTICNGCLNSLENHESKSSRVCPFCRTSLELSRHEIMELYKKRMELDDPEIIFCMACHYENGWLGLPKNKEKAFNLYLKAAELGSARACTNVGKAYGNDEVVKKNVEKQRYYLEKGAKLGEVRARDGLITLEYESGNLELALRHSKIAAVQGDPHSLPFILECYQVGMLGKEEYADILRANQRAKGAEWSKARELAKKQIKAKRDRQNKMIEIGSHGRGGNHQSSSWI